MTDSPRTAHIALTSYDLETGGISRVAVYLANGFAAAGHAVTLVLCNAKGDLHETLAAELADGVDLVLMQDQRARSRAWGQVRSFRAMRRWLRAARPDAVLGTSNNISWFTGLALAGLGGKRPALFIKTTNPILRRGDGPLLTALRRAGYARLFGAAKAVLTLSEAESRVLAAQFPQQADRFQAVFNPYVTPAFLAAQPMMGVPDDRPLLLGLGRLSPQKNFARLIRAFALARAQVRPDHPLAHAHLMIAGEGPLRGELEALVAQLGLEQAVSLPGFAADVPGLFARTSRFVLSSEYEGLPAVVIEALGSGRAVVATDCFAAARELLGGLPACKVCDLSVEALASALMASMAETPIPEHLRARAGNYSLPNAVASHLSLIVG
ncbi:MAG: glycosyltransferase [Erythrobacter sp.]|nr:glycosyltransferase [Erythrobacter sp.]